MLRLVNTDQCVCVCVIVCVHTVSGCDAQSQCVPGSPQDLGQVSVLQTSDRSALHRLQLVSRLNLPTASRRAATTHRHEPVRHQGGGCRETGGVTWSDSSQSN